MKASMKRLAPQFSTNRRLWDYSEQYYWPAARYHADLVADGGARAQRLAAWKANVFRHWAQVRVESVEARRPGAHRVGDEFALAAVVGLGGLTPHDVRVEAKPGGKLIAAFKDADLYNQQLYHWLVDWDGFLQRRMDDFERLLDEAGIPGHARTLSRVEAGMIVFYSLEKQ